MRLRLRSPAGVSTLSFSEEATLAELISRACQLAAMDTCTILTGFPPAEISLDQPEKKLALLVQDGDLLTVRAAPATSRAPSQPPPPAHSALPRANGETDVAVEKTNAADEDDDLRLALALSRGEAAQPSSAPEAIEPPIAHAQSDGEERMVRRVIPADNSCLFAAIAYALEGGASFSPAKKAELRERVASVVRTGAAAGDERYSEAMLGRPPLEYAKWISDSDHWGGATELDILSEHYTTELSAIDIKTGRVDTFGQGHGYRQRALLLYDGIHYDVLVRTLFHGAPSELDVTVFSVDDERALTQAREVAAEARSAREFTDTASFTIRCLVCHKGLRGESDAVEHAKATGHTNFSEYR